MHIPQKVPTVQQPWRTPLHVWPKFFWNSVFHIEKEKSVHGISYFNWGKWKKDFIPNYNKESTLKYSKQQQILDVSDSIQAELLHSDGKKSRDSQLFGSLDPNEYCKISFLDTALQHCIALLKRQMPPQGRCAWLCQHLQKYKSQLTVNRVSILIPINRNENSLWEVLS